MASRAASVVAWLFAVLTILAGVLYFAPHVGYHRAQDLIGLIATAVARSVVAVAVAALFAVVVAGWAGRRGNRALTWTALLAAVLAALVVIVPWLAAWRTARAAGASVSWTRYFDDPARPTPQQTTVYATVGGQQLRVDVYRPRQAGPGRPALVYVHGGSWRSGSRAENARWQRWVADQGLTVFAIDYRLSPPPRWQDAVGDVKCALGWVRAHAASYDVAPDNVTVGGDSAGGQLALQAAYTVGDPRFRPSCAVPEAPVRAVMAWYAPTDLSRIVNDSGLPGMSGDVLRDYLGGDLAAQRPRYDASSAVNQVRAGLPPTLLVQGGGDHLVPAAQAGELADRLGAARVPVRLLLIPWAEHGFTEQWGGWGAQLTRPAVAGFLRAYALTTTPPR